MQCQPIDQKFLNIHQIEKSETLGGHDFIGNSQTAVFGPGEEAVIRAVIFTINDDDIPEADETFALSLLITNGDGVLGQPSRGTVTIVANDAGFGVFGFRSVSYIFLLTE